MAAVKDKTTAGILAILLGGVGVHRFYLGQAGLGILYLLFFWTFIPSLLGIIDGIIFLTQDENDFDIKYNRDSVKEQLRQQQQPTFVINNNMGQPQAEATPTTPAPTKATEEERKSKKDPFEIEGDKKYEDYEFEGAIRAFLRSLNVKSANPEVHFKLAKLYSIMEKTDSSLFHLNQAIEKGFYDLDEIESHDHLAYLRSQEKFVTFRENGYRIGAGPREETEKLDLSDDLLTQLEKLAKLREQGILSEEEFSAQKQKLFNRR